MEGKMTRWEWVKSHKKQLAIVAGTFVVGGVCVYFGIKTGTFSKIKGRFKKIDPQSTLESVNDNLAEVISVVQPVIEKVSEQLLPQGIIENMTGHFMTATQLGNIVGCSNREINKRIVAKGLAMKCANGEYMLTMLGAQLGHDTWKITKANHSFSNIEWDTVILMLICTPEELALSSVQDALANQLKSA